jgi:hypothetical protein
MNQSPVGIIQFGRLESLVLENRLLRTELKLILIFGIGYRTGTRFLEHFKNRNPSRSLETKTRTGANQRQVLVLLAWNRIIPGSDFQNRIHNWNYINLWN